MKIKKIFGKDTTSIKELNEDEAQAFEKASQIAMIEFAADQTLPEASLETKEKKRRVRNTDTKLAEKKHYEGHRARLKEKVMQHGAESLKDYELLEILLTYSIVRCDVKPLAKQLLERFKTLRTLFLQDRATLTQTNGLGLSSACFITVLQELCCRIAREEIAEDILLNSPDKVINYCKLRMSGLSYEQFRVLFLNRKNKLILDEEVQTGTIDKAAIFPREIVKRALEVGAGAIILVHNHPSGDPTPSQADIDSTIEIQKAAKLMEVFLYDHIIIGRNNHYSMRGNKLI